MKRSSVALALVMAMGAPAAWAQADYLELLDALRANGTLDQNTYERLRDSAAASRQATVEENIDAPKITTNGKLEVESADGDFSMRVGGRIQMDAAAYDDDDAALGSGTELRRARLFVSGKMWGDWGYKLQYDFASDSINDAYLQYAGWDAGLVRVGHFKEPFSLENMTSSKYITFMERGLTSAFLPGRNIGVAGYTNGDNWSLSGGIFGDDGPSDAAGEENEGWGITARGTYAPVATDTNLVHLGGALSHRRPTNDEVRYRERPESHVTDVRLVDTGDNFIADANSFNLYGLEAAYATGPLALQGEYMRADVDRDDNSDPAFDGYYVEASWFLTGESRASAYSVSKGGFGKITPKGIVGKGGIGAWQVAVRYSGLDLSDAGVDGGEQRNATLGLNWYATPNIRFAANYVHVLEVDGGIYDGDEPSIFQVRGQVEF